MIPIWAAVLIWGGLSLVVWFVAHDFGHRSGHLCERAVNEIVRDARIK